ncbi:tryptophan halogenase [Cellvibrio mixtus]|uniref:Tryptophan halogenase n=1 Tax=Cellvibrio mixtus TaxID=39650 RepID=A0A266QAW6_9GAMM|nr:tryptophan halogenase family protein [Cellvibrio mixtus]OZY86521.1 tryptophan halogenase [Cellvibrio mixtus]
MSQTIKKVVIAGGGTSGWCAAVALSRQFGTLLDITLIESAEIGTVGVGEATFPTICSFHKIHGIDEQEFLSATKGSIKLAISFENWARKGDRYIHPFGSFGNASWIGDFYHYWLAAKARGYDGELDDICFELQAAKSHKFAITENPKLNYAYHFDAALYAKFLRKLSEEKGVHRIEGKIVQVKQHLDNGFIESVVLESGVAIEGDLFIDCTGFRGLLIEETLNAGYETWGQWLRNDSAVALQTEFSGDIPPYTRAIAHDSGWQWKIPLQHRQGTGHVYSSAYISDEDARNTLLQNLDGDIRAELRLLKFNTGRRKQAWVKNCVAIGLAGGFVEPLESTSIHLIQIGVHRLLRLFPFEGCNEYLIRRYNELSRIEYENIRDFIILHYKATERDDTPYWRDCRDMAIPDSLAERLELFRATGYVHYNSDEVFGVTSWLKVMTGQRIVPQGYHHFPHVISDEKIFSGLISMKEKIANAVKKMPSHTDFLKAYCTVK